MTEMKPYIVREGDDVAKVATSLGCDEDDIWKHEKNKGLQEEGRTKEALVPGDVLYVPDNPREPSPVQVENQNRFEAKQLAAQESKDDFDIHGCRLVVRLNKGASTQSTADAITADVVTSLLERIDKRLRTTLTSLDGVWSGANGGDASDNDEVWARLISEMMLGAVYDGTGLRYGYSNDVWHYERFEESAGCYPLAVACQQLSTISIMSRGVKLEQLAGISGKGLNAGGSEGVKLWKSAGASWQKSARYQNDLAWAVSNGTPVKPGSVYEFYDQNDRPNTDNAHIAFVLRTRRSPDRVQFFDTGAVRINRRNEQAALQTGATFDEPWATYAEGPGGKTSFSGTGIPPAPSDLGATIAELRRKFPLGFARLALRLRADDSVLYASPILRMHGSGTEDNWSVARHVWSLRDLPNADKVAASWTFYIPQKALTLASSRPARRAYNLRQLRLCAQSNARARTDIATTLAKGSFDNRRLSGCRSVQFMR